MSILSRYLDPEALGRMLHRRIEPRGLVIGNLAGAHKSPLSGFAVEFAGHREYSPGDDPKHIDWRVFYRRDKYFVKQYEMETNLVCHLFLDCSASMRYGDGDEQKLLYASRLATTLGHKVVHESDKVSLGTFDEGILGFVPPSNSMSQVARITEHLDRIEPRQKTNLAASLADLVGRTQRREIIMVFSDFFGDLDALEPVLQRMRYQKHEVVLFHVLHHDEWTFDFEGMTKFIGLEVDEMLLAEPQELRAGYLKAAGEFNDRFEDICQRNRCERVPVDTRREMGEVLIDYLNQRSMLNRGR